MQWLLRFNATGYKFQFNDVANVNSFSVYESK